MSTKNSIFIATSLDGFIADKNGGIDWLHTIPNPNEDDMGYKQFIQGIDAIVMGRKTFETVMGFDIPWPYKQPVFVLSNKMKEIPDAYKDKAFLVRGTLTEVLDHIHEKGYESLYIDGGTAISHFLKEDFIDEMTITTIPILLGGGSPLFTEMPKPLRFELVESKTFLNQIKQNHYRRVKGEKEART